MRKIYQHLGGRCHIHGVSGRGWGFKRHRGCLCEVAADLAHARKKNKKLLRRKARRKGWLFE